MEDNRQSQNGMPLNSGASPQQTMVNDIPTGKLKLQPGQAHVNNVSALKRDGSEISVNLGWKLHTALRKGSTVAEVIEQMGLKKGSGHHAWEIADREVFYSFIDRLDKLGADNFNNLKNWTPGLNKGFDREVTQNLVGAFVDFRLDGSEKTASLDDIFRFMEIAQDNNIGFKYGRSQYYDGKAATLYAGSIEERDRVISIMESQFGDRLEDSSENMRILKETGEYYAEVNHPISDNFTGRFTSEYAGVDPSTNSVSIELPDNDMAPESARGRVVGSINDDELARLGELVDDNPIVDELLHGKPGYDSPYSTIEDIIQERQKVTPAQAAAASSVPPATGSAANNAPPTPTTGAPTPVAQAAAASSVPPATGSAANAASQTTSAAAPASSAATIGTPATTISTSTAQAQAQAQASSNAQATSSTQRQTTQARVSSTPAASAVTAPSAGSTGAPVRGTQSLLKAGRGLSASVASGTKGYGNLKVLGAGLLVGVGAQKIASNQRENSRQRIDY